MRKTRTIPGRELSIWWLALGYFAFYVPYSGLTKALSKGLLPGTDGRIGQFDLIPAVAVGTVLMFLFIITISGWWKYAGYQKIGGIRIPFATNKYTFLSGLAAAVIIITTTLAYSFTGISIVFMALLMRGGVLIIAPMVDKLFGRRVHWYSWIAFGLSMLALLIVFISDAGFTLTGWAVLNISAYLGGYVFRLQFMTRIAKSEDQEANKRYFMEEMLVAMAVLALVPLILAIAGAGNIVAQLSAELSGSAASVLSLPALGIGALYACLYVFGTRIYLDKRENTFCIPVNRCSSLLAGVGAAFLLTILFDNAPVNGVQLTSAGILVIAITFLSIPGFFEKRAIRAGLNEAGFRKVYLFICPGNTARSPMAQAICRAELNSRLMAMGHNLQSAGVEVISAGLRTRQGAPMNPLAVQALEKIGVEGVVHEARDADADLISHADEVWCMSEVQKAEVLLQFPQASGKVKCIDPGDNLINPHGMGVEFYEECARTLQRLIGNRLGVFGMQPAYFQTAADDPQAMPQNDSIRNS